MEIEYHNREKEIKEITRILKTPPNLITFIYGPINSGKSSLMDEVVKRLSNDYIVFFIDLRAHIISNVDEFYEVLFSYDIGLERKLTKFSDIISYLVSSAVKVVLGFPLPEKLVGRVLQRNKPKNAFTYIFTILQKLKSKGKKPVIIMDELQTISDLKIDGPLIYELFNFFVTITKRYHLAHVFAVTSDSLFIEKVFNEAMLQGRCRYLLVDDFDYDTTLTFLKKYSFTKDEIELTWNYFGGKPVYLVEVVNNKHRLKEFCEEQLKLRFSQILDTVYEIEENKELFNGVIDLFKDVSENGVIKYTKIDDPLKFCAKKNILFVEPVNRIVKPQSHLDLLAIRKILQELNP